MRLVDYALREAWRSLWRSGGSGVSAVVAIALALLVLGALLLLTSNIERLIARWTDASEFSVYLRDDASSEQRGAIETMIDQSGVSAGREYVSKTQAMARFRREFTELASLTTEFDDNPFPASVEVRVQPAAEKDGRADTVVQHLGGLPGVADVRYDRDWLVRMTSALSAIRNAGIALAILMALAAGMTVASVVRIGLHNRRDEIELMQLVGSPVAFIRGPFIAEGLLQGGLGAVLAIGFLWLGFAATVVWWGTALAAMLDGGAVEFLPIRFCAALVAGGMAVGGIGGFAASRHAV